MHQVLQPELFIAMAAVLAAGIVRGFSGFGAAMMMAPVFAILYSPPQAVGTMATLSMLASLQLLPSVARQTNWREVIALGVAACLTIPLGSLLLISLSADVMRRAIAGIVLTLVLVLMSGWRYPGRPTLWAAGGAGLLSGLINGATGVGGPPVVLYLLAGPNSAATSRATFITFAAILSAVTSLSLVVHGVYTLQTLWRALALWPVQIASLATGAWLFRHANDAIYRRIALAVLLAVALFGLFYRR